MASGSCVGSIAKFVLLLINLHFILVSLGFILFGSRLHLSKDINDVVLDVGNLTFTWSYIATGCIVVGAILGLVSLFGFTAALCESAFLLNAYAFFLLLVVGSLGLFHIYLVVFFNAKSIEHLREYYDNLMSSYYKNDNAMMIVDSIQKNFYCCGSQSPEDWRNISFAGQNESTTEKPPSSLITANSSLFEFPKSCCKMYGESSEQCYASEIVYILGCFSPVTVTRIEYLFHGYFIATMAALLLLMTISCCLERTHELKRAKIVNLQV